MEFITGLLLGTTIGAGGAYYVFKVRQTSKTESSNNSKNEFNILHEEKELLTKKNKQYLQDIKALENSLRKLELEIKVMEEEHEDVEEELSDAMVKMRRLNSENETLRNQAEQDRLTIFARDAEIEKLKEKL